jgi:hypothetical protein
MNIQLLIDSIVRQTTVLIAQLATAGGVRAPLANVASQVFLDLSRELDNQGVSRKVSADMFGMALRTYQRKVSRMRESATVHGRSLWEAVFDYLREGKVVSRAEVLRRFRNDDEVLVKGVLYDLTESGLVFATGSGAHTSYRVASESELERIGRNDGDGTLDNLVWAIIYREGPLAAREITERFNLRADTLDKVLERLKSVEHIAEQPGELGPVYSAQKFVVELGDAAGWEAAVFDHYQAMVSTICRKLQLDPVSGARDTIGGSTYTFAVWEGHPMEHEVVGELGRYRKRMSDLRREVDEYNEQEGIPARHKRVISYGGQCVIEQDGSENQEESDV